MHCTAKKTTQLIIEGGNDYILTVKDNQNGLLAQLETLAKQAQPEDRFVDALEKAGANHLSDCQCFHRFKWY